MGAGGIPQTICVQYMSYLVYPKIEQVWRRPPLQYLTLWAFKKHEPPPRKSNEPQDLVRLPEGGQTGELSLAIELGPPLHSEKDTTTWTKSCTTWQPWKTSVLLELTGESSETKFLRRCRISSTVSSASVSCTRTSKMVLGSEGRTAGRRT